MQMSAVDLRITAHFTHLGSHGAKTRSGGAEAASIEEGGGRRGRRRGRERRRRR
ncbi:unnamed protein product [Staurois parvus]|uniref:Uncharacterized protein n=1 Tax=Staurois parvus TaxID=386267 RepID=A0ABN9B1L9_9NEOB|nr:unnamed protein product [Staurois parvus]